MKKPKPGVSPSFPLVSAPEAAAALGVSSTTAWRALEDLVKAGKARQIKALDPKDRRYTTA